MRPTCAPRALAAYLDRDPSRNLCTLAHAVREEPRAWGPALADELQPLARQSPLGVVLCGPPKREMRTSIAPAFLERLLVELAHRYRYVVVDVGPDLLGMETAAANHRAALASARHVLVVSASDLVGLWHARTALDQFERQLGIDRRSVSLVLNRHDPRYHHGQSEVEWHLGAPIAAVVPFDHQASQRAIAEQRPLVVDPTSRASRALISLAERVHDGKLRLPIEPLAPRQIRNLVAARPSSGAFDSLNAARVRARIAPFRSCRVNEEVGRGSGRRSVRAGRRAPGPECQ